MPLSSPRNSFSFIQPSLFQSEPGITNQDISNDFRLFENISFQNNISCKSFIFPRNQVNDIALKELKKHEFKTYRGNLQNFIQKDGHKDSQSLFFKLIRFGDSYIQISKDLSYKNSANENLLNVPGSLFLRPVNSKTPYVLNKMHIKRIKKSMTIAAQNKETFHLWWHPHNFGNSTDDNLLNLRDILEHYTVLSNEHGMTSKNMGRVYCMKILLLATNSETTNILINSLKSSFDVEVIFEEKVSKINFGEGDFLIKDSLGL